MSFSGRAITGNSEHHSKVRLVRNMSSRFQISSADGTWLGISSDLHSKALNAVFDVNAGYNILSASVPSSKVGMTATRINAGMGRVQGRVQKKD
jgi:hypothetical protein